MASRVSLVLALGALLSGCKNGVSTTGLSGSGGSGTTSGATTGAVTSATTTTGTGTGGAASSTVTFQYTPAWDGVTAVDVVGGFGMATDWDPKNPAVKLTKDATGKWTGALSLPTGTYPYLFHVVGDSAAPAGSARYAIDPDLSAYVACPSGSPSYTAKASNPCSELAVPQAAPASTQHVTGKVVDGGTPTAGYLAIIERTEAMSHHYFVNRMDTAADGSFDLSVAPGKYRIQVLYPSLLSKTDAERDPLTLKALRRGISTSFDTTMPVTLKPIDVAFDYSAFAPTTTTSTLPTTFKISLPTGATKARAAVYGTNNGMGKNIGDPWFASPYATATSVSFNGTFNTMQATETQVKTGEAYFWGSWVELDATWTGESMVLPITWN